MNTGVSGVQMASVSSGRLVCWVESLIVGLGVPASIWIISKLISLSIPAAVHGSAEQRFLLWILGGVIVEWFFVVVLWFVLRTRGSSFKDLGVWRLGTWPAWVMALLFAALSIAAISGSFPECISLSHMRSCPPDFTSLPPFFWESPLDSVKRCCFAPF